LSDTIETKVAKLHTWAFGNGTRGSEERLQVVEDKLDKNFTGERVCAGHKKIDKHIEWHEKSKRQLWAVMVPVYITLIALILQIAGVIG